jgi:hypothetical protein
MNRCPKCLEEVDVFGAHDRPIYIWEWQGGTAYTFGGLGRADVWTLGSHIDGSFCLDRVRNAYKSDK